jgi:hypothetical protein
VENTTTVGCNAKKTNKLTNKQTLGFHKINIVPCKEKETYEQMKENLSTEKLSIVYAMSFIADLHAHRDITFSLNIHVMNLKILEESV